MRQRLSESTSKMFHIFLLSVSLLVGANGQSTIANYCQDDSCGGGLKIQLLDQMQTMYQGLSSRIETIEKKFQARLESFEKTVKRKFKVMRQTKKQGQAPRRRYVDGVRLVNPNSMMTRNQSAGRLEILYNGTWGTVCDDRFSDAAARVVCARLGYGRTGTYARNLFGPGRDPIWLSNVVCNGNEKDIATCDYRGWGDVNCHHSEDVSIICQGNDSMHAEDVRLVNHYSEQENLTSGRLEVLKYGVWGTVGLCDNFTNDAVARVACASLGFGRVGSVIGNAFGRGSGNVWLDNIVCNGSENDIGSCRHSAWGSINCWRRGYVSIFCGSLPQRIDDMRLVNRYDTNNNQSTGRLEILFAGTWGTVCSNGFTDAAAHVVCARLGFGRSGAFWGSEFGDGTGPIWLDNVNCNGNENDIANCRHSPWGVHRCTHSQDVSVSCNQDSG